MTEHTLHGVWGPEWRADRVGKRIQANLTESPDAFDALILREFDGLKWWIPLSGAISPVIPLLLGMARIEDHWDSVNDMPLTVKPDPTLWHECLQRWLREHRSVRERLRLKCGRSRWRKPSDIDGALILCPSELVVPLKLWKLDSWCWSREWS